MGAGFFQLIVRPNVFPSVRPQRVSSSTPALDIEDRLFVVESEGAKVLRLDSQSSYSYSKQKYTERKRRFDIVKVKNEADPTQFVRAEIMTALRMKQQGRRGTAATGNVQMRVYERPIAGPTVEIEETNKFRP